MNPYTGTEFDEFLKEEGIYEEVTAEAHKQLLKLGDSDNGPENKCALCGCALIRKPGVYALPTVEGRSHATKHHLVAERFFGRSANRKGEQRESVFTNCPWKSA